MKNLFAKLSLCLLISLIITSCSVESLADQDLRKDNQTTSFSNEYSKNDEITLYISWEEGINEIEKDNLRTSLLFPTSIVQLHSFYIDESLINREEWQVTFETQDETKPIIWLKEGTVVEVASFEPF